MLATRWRGAIYISRSLVSAAASTTLSPPPLTYLHNIRASSVRSSICLPAGRPQLPGSPAATPAAFSRAVRAKKIPAAASRP
ncbi:MAG: hypothetical protein ABIQ44_05405, partial [Chloroflexia bacterium]